jgi:adenylate cyclase
MTKRSCRSKRSRSYGSDEPGESCFERSKVAEGSICRISVEEGLEFCSPRSKGERIVAERLNFSPETRLACQTKITGDVNVRRLVVDDDDIEFTRGIAEGPRPASIGEEKNLAILFADVRGFTALSERMSPYDVIYFLNRYFHLTSKVIESYGGYVDNYMSKIARPRTCGSDK